MKNQQFELVRASDLHEGAIVKDTLGIDATTFEFVRFENDGCALFAVIDGPSNYASAPSLRDDARRVLYPFNVDTEFYLLLS
jgi:hypothetical protein